MHFYAWKHGLKTGQYYFRSRPARDAIKFTVNVDMLLQAADKGSANQILEVLNSDNNEANQQRKRKRVEKPAEAKPVVEAKKPLVITTANGDVQMKVDKKEEKDAEDSYEFDPVCHNCSG
jgi:hypothetical protein